MENEEVSMLDDLKWKKFKCLDDGFVCLVDVMGDDAAIVQAARVSYGEGTTKKSSDRSLIRFLMRHRHTTPFEMAEIKFMVRVPMDAWRQWIRHRTACLAEGTEIYFDLPGGVERRGNQLYKLKIEELWDRFQPTENKHRPDKQRNSHHRRERIQSMKLRHVNEETLEIDHVRLINVHRNGQKPVFRVTLGDGKQIECTADHRFLFSDGWKSLHQATGLEIQNDLAVWDQGDCYLYVNGTEIQQPALYQDRDWLDRQYNVQGKKIQDIADICGVSYHTIRKWIREHELQHAKGGRSKEPWNKGKTYKLGRRELSEAWKDANRRSRSGESSNFWKGGVSTDRQNIARWTTQIAHHIHQKNGWTCQLCKQRASELHCHHVVPVWAEESLAREESNLTTLCGDCHRSIQGRELEYIEQLNGPPVKAEWKKRPRVPWNKLTVAKLVRVESFEYVGMKETYDLEVEGPHHNFIANGVVTHNSVNEYSTRYSLAIDSAQITGPEEWRMQSGTNKQGSGEFLSDHVGSQLSASEERLQVEARVVYDERIKAGVAREQARKDLPLSTYTEAYWKMDLHNLFHFLSLRMDPHAQKEIRDYAKVIGEEIVAKLFPIAWEAFEDYRLKGMFLTRQEVELIRDLNRLGGDGISRDSADMKSVQPEEWKNKEKCRERDEAFQKLERLGVQEGDSPNG